MTNKLPTEPNIVRPPIERHPVHHTITEVDISRLVDVFYTRVRADARLGSVFEARLEGRWEPHLAKMKLFWSSVLLKTGHYKGKPVPAHVTLTQVQSDDFQIWLTLFRKTAEEIFAPEAAALIIKTAERIAQSLWLAMFATPFNGPPEWLRGSGSAPDSITC
ncbi:MAG: group III truncated hemoglobin [Stappiaceae bacterium]